MSNKTAKNLAAFALKYPGKWHGYKRDAFTVGDVCAVHNLGIIHLNEYGQFKLRSAEKANRWLDT